MKLYRLLPVLFSLLLALTAAAAGPADSLETGFLNPPQSARPQTWWHWMNGNITREGITADLEAMKHIGLGGATIVNVDCGIPHGPIQFMSPEWRDLFKFAVQEANRLGLQLCVENCAGWSSSGGPWNVPSNAMQRVVSSNLRITGPTNFNDTIPQPTTTLNFYRDIAVLAFPASADDGVRMRDYAPTVSVSAGDPPGNKLTDGNVKTLINLPAPQPGQPQFAQLEFSDPLPARSVRIVGAAGMPDCSGEICVSDDGKTFRSLRPFTFTRGGATARVIDLGDQPVSARFWRVQFTAASGTIPLAEIQIAPRQLIDNLGAKAGVSGDAVLSSAEPADVAYGMIQRRNIVDLTSKLTADGRLNWRVPAGEWIILRLGHTPTGKKNAPAPKEGEGLECDKFSKAALDAHWDGFMQKVLDDIGPLAGKTLDSSLIDSYEVGGQNWTENFRQEFKKRRGYDLLKFLPAITGRIVDNPAVSERFLWDVRRTISDLFAENYYGHFAELCRRHGLANAVEPYTGPFESLQCGATADVVMGEFWTGSQGHPSIKLAASVAHIYGKSVVAAESFTAAPEPGRWQNDPYSLKTLGDLMYCQGLNRYVFHRYAMQPWTNHLPGMTMGQWGFHFERTETWWEQGKPWIDYISHCQFLLQRGRPVMDIAYFTGESTPVEIRVGNPALPAGYDFDAINTDVLLHRATVKNGRITLPDGVSYAALILPVEDPDYTPATLQRIRELVRAGATVVGPRPTHSPSLAGFPGCDTQVKKLADELWGKCDGTTVLENSDGKGRVVWGKSMADVFAAQHLEPDFTFQGSSSSALLTYTHRVAGESHIYFVSNQRRQFASAECSFRVSGKIPELWHPDTGRIEPALVWGARDGRTTVRLDFEPAGSVFVIFRQAVGNADHLVAASGGAAPEPAPQPKLEIQNAVYTSVDSAARLDVTAKISALVHDNQLVVVPDNGTMGRDPAVNHEKELRVDFTLDGKPLHIAVHEGETLMLPEATFLGRAPQWELISAANGSPAVRSWENGRVELRTARGTVLHADAADLPASSEVTGAWQLSFPPNWGAPPSVTLDQLISWPDHTNDGVRYFSGTATYEKQIEITPDRLQSGRELWLDLGRVKNFAEVSLNGRDFAVLWKPPFRVNLTAAAKPGTNRLVVKVTNLWPNRLIGDEQLPPDRQWSGKQLRAWPQWFLDGQPSPTGRFTFTTWHHWTKDSSLLESGLLGPVTLLSAEMITAR